MEEPAGAVVVVGSANLDVVLGVTGLPRAGETVLAHDRALGPGGKGANQAIAAARSGARTAFVAALGDDNGGDVVRAALAESDVVTTLLRASAEATGTAYVIVDADGENCIVVHAGANAGLVALSPEELDVIGRSDVLLCQLEVPLETVQAALQHGRQARVLTVLNAAPARPLPPDLLRAVDVLVVNEHEAHALAGSSGSTADAAGLLLDAVAEVVVTLGAAGALLLQRGVGATPVPAPPASAVVDTTGAGDTFCGAFAAARARGAGSVDAVRTACAAASLSVERHGAAASAPTLSEIMAKLSSG